ncbi:hypothetical protein [Parablautia sp. Marseille-Q6255]|uniref:hypothetical protein n=1 Tax=Parablautia sp. Marseille-Q6255 TaxID=3039593 RepID=UPI0024BCB24E|nr:hypothetical protein [Parablautia sp. Marseille-Q6255]
MRRIRVCAGMFITALFFLLAVRFCTAARRYSDTAVILLEGQALDTKQAAGLCEQEKEQEQGFCFWGEQDAAQLVCRETGGMGTVKTVLTQGNPELIVPGIGMLAYQDRGCFVDAQTAQELFGTQQAAGQTVWCDERAYTVCGVVESLDRIMIRQAAEEDGPVLHMVSVYLTQSGSGSGEAQQFLIRSGLDGKVMDTGFLNAAAQDLLLLLPLLLGVWLVSLLAGQIRCSTRTAQRLLYAAGTLGAAAVICFFVFRHLQIPADMIPTKWSDFSFWEQWWEKQRENLLLIFRTAKGEAQLTMLWNLGLGMLCNLCAVCSEVFLLLLSGRDGGQSAGKVQK